MYQLARIFLVLAVVCGAYSLVLIIVLWPAAGVVAALLWLVGVRKRRPHLTTLGSARWADEDDLRAAGMLGAGSGLLLGRIPKELASRRSPAAMLFDGRITARE